MWCMYWLMSHAATVITVCSLLAPLSPLFSVIIGRRFTLAVFCIVIVWVGVGRSAATQVKQKERRVLFVLTAAVGLLY